MKDVTLLNERATIGNLNRWGLEQGFISQNKLPVWAELRKTNIGSRTAFNKQDYQTLYGFLRRNTQKTSLMKRSCIDGKSYEILSSFHPTQD